MSKRKIADAHNLEIGELVLSTEKLVALRNTRNEDMIAPLKVHSQDLY